MPGTVLGPSESELATCILAFKAAHCVCVCVCVCVCDMEEGEIQSTRGVKKGFLEEGTCNLLKDE